MRLPTSFLTALFVLGVLTWTTAPAHAQAAATRPPVATHETDPWARLGASSQPGNFQFAIVADRTGGHRPGVFAAAMDKVNLLQPEFVMCIGDLIEGYTEDRQALEAQWDELVGLTCRLEMPFFYVPGNHDISNPVQAEVWRDRFGPSYYNFVYRDVLFLCLNTEDAAPMTISDEQVAYVRQVLADNTGARWTVVFMHEPLWAYVDMQTGTPMVPAWAQIEEMLAERPHTVFAGHLHGYMLSRRHGRRYFTLATTGGASMLTGPLQGQFDQVVWVTMGDAGPQVANLRLDGILDQGVRTEEMAMLMDRLLHGRAVTVGAILTEEKKFSGGTTQLRLANGADLPLHVAGAFAANAHLRVDPGSVDLVVPAGETRTVDLQVTAGRKTPVADLEPVTFSWSAAYQQTEPAVPPVDGTASLVVGPIFEAGRRRSPATVDGDLSDWRDLPYRVTRPAQVDVAPDSWMGPADCSWRFGVEEGPEYLYVAVEVTDDALVYTRQLPWQQDGVEVRIDGRPDPERSANRGDDNSTLVVVGLSPGRTPADEVVFEPGVLDSLGVRVASRPTATGHAYEMAVPLAYFAARQGRDWRYFRLNVAVDDFDQETGPLAQLWWLPDWRDPGNYPGSGTFRRPAK